MLRASISGRVGTQYERDLESVIDPLTPVLENQEGRASGFLILARVAELADARDLGSRAARREGSTPSSRIGRASPLPTELERESDGFLGIPLIWA